MNQFESIEARILFLIYTLYQNNTISLDQKGLLKDNLVSKENGRFMNAITQFEKSKDIDQLYGELNIRLYFSEFFQNNKVNQTMQFMQGNYIKFEHKFQPKYTVFPHHGSKKGGRCLVYFQERQKILNLNIMIYFNNRIIIINSNQSIKSLQVYRNCQIQYFIVVFHETAQAALQRLKQPQKYKKSEENVKSLWYTLKNS
ncbi:unnamed protein product [Paramecium octaurelia]|uniref:Uncharacterized protein n=1 Tax=Paramecium octaurelia TaxID=43137 RepID=A0A8S1VN75_PAROT|nr:unnamed protein product [Paramecium octaurelia]